MLDTGNGQGCWVAAVQQAETPERSGAGIFRRGGSSHRTRAGGSCGAFRVAAYPPPERETVRPVQPPGDAGVRPTSLLWYSDGQLR